MIDDDQAWLPRLLREFGYRGRRRDDAWSEVLITREAERWWGRGPDHEAAVADVLAQMLPSAVARALYDGASTTPAPPRDATDARGADEPAAIASPSLAAPTAPPSASAEPEPPAVEPEVRVVEPPKVGQRVVLPTPSYPAAAIAEARDTLDDILKEIHDARPDFALMAPRLQKVHMLAWICRARGLDEQFAGEHRVGALVRRVAHELTNISKIMWPGSVQALQMNARPDCVVGELGLKTIHFPRTWSDASEFVQQHRERALASDAQLDDYGWADVPRPAPGDPRAQLREAVALIEELAGSIQEPPPRHLNNPPEDMSPENLEALVKHVQQLRAIRSHTLSPEVWGAAMGRMRWLAGRLGDRAQQLRKWLDPEFRPPIDSARGGALQQEQLRTRQAAVQAEFEESVQGTPAALGPWLVKAFDVFNTKEIAGIVEPLRALIPTLDDDVLPDADRRVRRRLRDLRAYLHENDGRELPPPTSEPVEPDDVKPEPASDEVDDPSDPLEALVRGRVDGKSALFVSNRDDPDLKARLEDRLGLKLTWCDGNPRKVQAQCDSIARRSYDLVLIATGFQAHTIDGILARAARAVGVPYVRVFKGRPLACVRALARTFGLAESHAA